MKYIMRNLSLILFVSFVKCSLETTDLLRNATLRGEPYLLSSQVYGHLGNWGLWGPVEMCPPKTHVIGFQSKLEPDQGSNDDTCLNGIIAICSDKSTISSTIGPWGNWGSISYCELSSKVIGFQIKVEAPQGSGDDTATNAVRFLCSNSQVLISAEGPYGNWMPNTFVCKPSYHMCGIQTQVEPSQGNRDDTALNNIAIICCID